MPTIRPPYQRGLVELHHRLAAAQAVEKLARIARVHAASLPRAVPPPGQAGPDKQETPGLLDPEVSTNRSPVRRIHGGCYQECA